MPHVDDPSRAPYKKPHNLDTASLRIAKINVSEMHRKVQKEQIREIIENLKSGDKYTGKDILWAVPKPMRWRVIQGQYNNPIRLKNVVKPPKTLLVPTNAKRC